MERSEASYLIFRPASVAKACEAHEALTFLLLLGQAKSNRKEILRFALNDKLIVNCYAGLSEREFRKWARINANNRVCHSERSEESRLERPRRPSLGPRAVSRRSSEQGERKSGCPKRSELPDFPTCERRDDVRSARSLDLLVTFGSSQK